MMSFLSYLRSTYRLNKGWSDLSLLKHRKIYIEWLNQIESKKTPLDLELPWITIIAKDHIDDFLKTKSKSDVKVFEFGSGGSSLFFLKYSNQVVSVEHDKKWFELVSNKVKQKSVAGWTGQLIEPESIEKNSHSKLDAGNPQHYYTTDEIFLNCTFKDYASYIDKFPDNYFDIVLVDGRSRPSCIYHSINKVKKGGLLILDNAEREYYLSKKIINENKFKMIVSSYSAIICHNAFSQTNIYSKI